MKVKDKLNLELDDIKKYRRTTEIASLDKEIELLESQRAVLKKQIDELDKEITKRKNKLQKIKENTVRGSDLNRFIK